MGDGRGDVARHLFGLAVPVLDQIEVLFERYFFLGVGGSFWRFGDAGAVPFILGEEIVEPLGEILDSFQIVAFDSDNGTTSLYGGTGWAGFLQRRTDAAE